MLLKYVLSIIKKLDQIYLTINSENLVDEPSPEAKDLQRKIPMQPDKDPNTHPHAFWIGHDGKIMITPKIHLPLIPQCTTLETIQLQPSL